MKPTILKNESFGQRIVLRRIYVKEGEVKKEALLLLTELLNLSFLSQKKCYSSLAGGTLLYDLVNFRGGYLLTAKLSQSKTQGVSYVFKNPYKIGDELLLHFKKSNLSSDEKTFAVSKERLLGRQHALRDGFSFLLSESKADYSSVLFDEKIVRDIKIEGVLDAFDKVEASSYQDLLLLGEPLKKEPLLTLDGTEKSPSSLVNDFSLEENNFVLPDCEKEGRLYLLSLKGRIENEKDYLLENQALFLLASALKKRITGYFGSEVRVMTTLLSETKAGLYLECEKGKFPLLLTRLPLSLKECIDLAEASASYPESIIGFNKMILSRSIDSSLALSFMERYKDYALPISEECFLKKENPEEEVLSHFHAMKPLSFITLNATKEEKQHD